jgi:arginyl-tRNA synthetase
MVHLIEKAVRQAIRRHIRKVYGEDLAVVTERPPRIEMGEIASPVCFELAKRMKRPPRLLAQEIAAAIKPVDGVERFDVAGGGYLNAHLDRADFFRQVFEPAEDAAADAQEKPVWKTIVEHTSINPNKAAHIGHLRNAVLGDTFGRILRHLGRRVEIQNYIDNTGVQVADVVLGFVHMEKRSVAEVREMAAQPRFDYLCWDLYARVTHFLEEDKTRLPLRGQTLKRIEEDEGDEAEMAELISTAIVACHLRTLDRLEIDYDLLARESDTLHLKFWEAAFAELKTRNAVRLVDSGKNAGCWVMNLPESEPPSATPSDKTGDEANNEPTDQPAKDLGAEDDSAKVIVRSSGTVTYVGKDIGYHLWKFGLLRKDFHYRPFHTHPDGHVAWMSGITGEANAPEFGHADEVFNVIDTRQAYPQQVVAAGLRALGYNEQADRLTHLDYEVVALTPRCAIEMGYTIAEEDSQRPFIEVSGRKGQGVKADDLLDQLEERARAEVDSRHPKESEESRKQIAHEIAVGALRYFMLRFTRTAIIAFDFRDALSFDGETGPYAQYAAVRASGIFRKLGERASEFRAAEMDAATVAGMLAPPAGNGLWELLLLAGSPGAAVEAAVNTREPAFPAKYAFQLAQAFNVFYHKHRILAEEDAAKRAFLLRLTEVVRHQLGAALGLLGIAVPEKM